MYNLKRFLQVSLILASFFNGSLFAKQNFDKPLSSVIKTCETCHGVQGVSINSDWPNLAGQKFIYLADQLKKYRSGERKNLLMEPIVKTLSDEKINQLAKYYSQQIKEKNTVEKENVKGKNVRSYCISCHGVKGITVNSQWPNLAGQQKNYLQTQLFAFKNDTRTNPQMQVIAKELTDAQIEDVAEYFSQQ